MEEVEGHPRGTIGFGGAILKPSIPSETDPIARSLRVRLAPWPGDHSDTRQIPDYLTFASSSLREKIVS